jgi:hypothetical protein
MEMSQGAAQQGSNGGRDNRQDQRMQRERDDCGNHCGAGTYNGQGREQRESLGIVLPELSRLDRPGD